MLVDTKPEQPPDLSSNWQKSCNPQKVEEMASWSQETKRLPDPYYFTFNLLGELYSPSGHCVVKNKFRRETRTDELEYKSFEETERWANQHEAGVMAWISPPAEGVYTESKIVIYEIGNLKGDKVLFNRAIILDLDEAKCLKFAQDLERYSTNRPLLSSLDQVRETPLVLNGRIHWTYLLEELVDGLSLKDVRLGEDLKSKQKALLEAERVYRENYIQSGWIDQEVMYAAAMKSGLMGDFNPRCPLQFGLSPFDFVFANSLLLNQKENNSCEKIKCCNKEIECSWEATDEEAEKVSRGEITCCPKCGWKPG